MGCKNCKNWKRGKVTAEIWIAGEKILFEDAPAMICQDCGNYAIAGKYSLDLEKKILQAQNRKPSAT